MRHTIASLRHILMGRHGDYFLNYIDYSKNFDAILKLLLAGIYTLVKISSAAPAIATARKF